MALSPPPGALVEQVLLAMPGMSVTNATPPFQISIKIPDDATGELALTALGKNSQGDFFTANTVTLIVRPAATLQGITILPSEVSLISVGDTKQINVLGAYSDGITREVSSSALGTQYVSSTPTVASVSAEGLLTAKSLGATTLTVINGALQSTIMVNVYANANPALGSIFSDNFESGDTSVWSFSAP